MLRYFRCAQFQPPVPGRLERRALVQRIAQPRRAPWSRAWASSLPPYGPLRGETGSKCPLCSPGSGLEGRRGSESPVFPWAPLFLCAHPPVPGAAQSFCHSSETQAETERGRASTLTRRPEACPAGASAHGSGIVGPLP